MNHQTNNMCECFAFLLFLVGIMIVYMSCGGQSIQYEKTEIPINHTFNSTNNYHYELNILNMPPFKIDKNIYDTKPRHTSINYDFTFHILDGKQIYTSLNGAGLNSYGPEERTFILNGDDKKYDLLSLTGDVTIKGILSRYENFHKLPIRNRSKSVGVISIGSDKYLMPIKRNFFP